MYLQAFQRHKLHTTNRQKLESCQLDELSVWRLTETFSQHAAGSESDSMSSSALFVLSMIVNSARCPDAPSGERTRGH